MGVGMKGYLTTGQAARRLGVSDRAIRYACSEGRIPGVQIDEGGHWRIPADWIRGKIARIRDAIQPIRRRVRETVTAATG